MLCPEAFKNLQGSPTAKTKEGLTGDPAPSHHLWDCPANVRSKTSESFLWKKSKYRKSKIPTADYEQNYLEIRLARKPGAAHRPGEGGGTGSALLSVVSTFSVMYPDFFFWLKNI